MALEERIATGETSVSTDPLIAEYGHLVCSRVHVTASSELLGTVSACPLIELARNLNRDQVLDHAVHSRIGTDITGMAV